MNGYDKPAALADALLWPLLALPMTPLFGTWEGMYGGTQTGWTVTGWVLLVGVVLVLSRAYPVGAWLLSTLSGFFNPWFIAVIVVTSYRVGFWSTRTRPALVGFAAIVGGAILLTVVPRWNPSDLGSMAMTLFTVGLTLVLAGVLPWLAGRYWRFSQQLTEGGWERAAQLEREQRILAEQARLRERARIAQDMHDSLGHELSLIALRAGGLQVAEDLSDEHREAARQLRLSAAAATERLREIIGVLQEDAASPPTEPTHETVADLVERARDSGMTVALRSAGDAARLTPMVDRAIHRVVLESLTNAAKHAPGAPVTVTVRHTDTEAVVSVTNGSPSRSPDEPQVRSGNHGLAGMRERVRLAGGTLRAGPAGDGFEVVARLPYAPGPADPARRRDTPDARRPDDPATSAPQSDEPTESARHLELVRRQARRGLVTTIAVPAALTVVLAIAMGACYLLVGHLSVLPPDEFTRLRLGESRAEVELALPPLQMLDAPADRGPAPPPGAECRHYRPQGPPGIRYAYRLCFSDDRLVGKYAVPTGSTDPSDVPTEGTGTL